jgi:hypothetical protein
VAETFQKAIHYRFANSKGVMEAACNKTYLLTAIEHHFIILGSVSNSFENYQKVT